MPNWCFTQYEVTGKQEEVEALYKKMKELEEMKESLEPNGFGKRWLGNLVKSYGGDWNTISCRGDWQELTLDNHILSFSTETAWAPATETFDFIKEKLPSLRFLYRAEEPGMEIYCTNDAEGVSFPERYYVDICVDGEYDAEYFIKEESAFEWLSEKLGREIESISDVDAFNDEYSDSDASDENYAYVHKFDVIYE